MIQIAIAMKILNHQHWHFLSLFLLLLGVGYFVQNDPALLKGQLWGISSFHWLLFSILVPIIHQLYVLIGWRSELHFQFISKHFGKNGFHYFKNIFIILILLRPISIILLAISNEGSLSFNSILSTSISIILAIPSLYLFYSVGRYFGSNRAVGRDHFEPDLYRGKPMVARGIFKYSKNSMYLFGFLLLWIPGIFLQSKAAIVSASFSHLYIWVHYFFTERPDMELIYGSNHRH